MLLHTMDIAKMVILHIRKGAKSHLLIERKTRNPGQVDNRHPGQVGTWGRMFLPVAVLMQINPAPNGEKLALLI